jgi:hypothetical protein
MVRPQGMSKSRIMAVPISLSPNFCEVRFSGQNALFHLKWKSLEDVALTTNGSRIIESASFVSYSVVQSLTTNSK